MRWFGGGGSRGGGGGGGGATNRGHRRGPIARAAAAFVVLTMCQRSTILAVDRSKFRKCSDTGFCKQFRDVDPEALPRYSLTSVASHVKQGFFGGVLRPLKSPAATATKAVDLAVQMRFYDDGTFRVKVKESQPLRPRFEPTDIVLEQGLNFAEIHVTKNETAGTVRIRFGRNQYVMINTEAFDLQLFVDDKPVVGVNSNKLMHLEPYRKKTAQQEVDGAGKVADAAGAEGAEDGDRHKGKKVVGYWEDGLAIYEDGTREEKPSAEEEAAKQRRLQEAAAEDDWKEYFGGHTDTRPYGPASVGLDVTFYGSQNLYGLPEHASSFRLKTTRGANAAYSEPYRLYNLDVFEYELDEPMALYGSIPFVASHTPAGSVGAFFFNPCETFVDIQARPEGYETHWMSECGVIDLFVFAGPKPADVARQLTRVVGRQALPPAFSLGYHQCRWNYKDEKDVAQVHGKFEELDFPYDVLWLDIEHTDGKRYFTWDKNLFPDPESMQKALDAQGRKMVTIIDPHIKRDDNYYIHKEATEKGLYIKDKDGNDFDGFCWPGQSSYLDFTDAKVREWWAEQFQLGRYNGSTTSLFTWNDMNEPSVFNGPEVSMSKDCKNLAGVEHREWHNLYGMFMHRATAEGQVKRKKHVGDRPFVLSRSFFAGSQRFGAIWTGDNHASWDHLAIAAPMLLSLNIAGLSFAGADVGGFFGDTDAELMTRWMQAGAFQPFFRGHAHHDTKRKEPWVYGEPTTSRIRKAVVARYTLLPYWYLTFYHAYKHGLPVMRPLWFEYPKDEATYGMDDQWLIGGDLLVKPVTAAGVSELSVYFPGSEPWYDIETTERVQGPGAKKVKAPIDKIPVFQRGGSIVPRKMRLRRSASLMREDPYTLMVALDKQNHADGALYLDDEVSTMFQQESAYVNVTMRGGSISAQKLAVLGTKKKKMNEPHKKFKQTIERIVVMGFQDKPKSVSITGSITGAVEQVPRNLDFDYDGKKKVLTIRKPDVLAVEDWIVMIR